MSIEQEFQDNESRRRMWEQMFLQEGWKEILAYLEKRYIEIGQEDSDSIKKLAARNARLSEIRRIFAFVFHDFKIQDALVREFRSIASLEDELPDKWYPGV